MTARNRTEEPAHGRCVQVGSLSAARAAGVTPVHAERIVAKHGLPVLLGFGPRLLLPVAVATRGGGRAARRGEAAIPHGH